MYAGGHIGMKNLEKMAEMFLLCLKAERFVSLKNIEIALWVVVESDRIEPKIRPQTAFII